MPGSRNREDFMTRLDERPEARLGTRPIDDVHPIRQIGFGECRFQVKEPGQRERIAGYNSQVEIRVRPEMPAVNP